MHQLTRDQVSALPLILLFDPQEDRAAAYDAANVRITDHASAELIRYALQKKFRQAAYDPERVKRNPPDWRSLPVWATPAIQKRLQVIWVRSGFETEGELKNIPSA